MPTERVILYCHDCQWLRRHGLSDDGTQVFCLTCLRWSPRGRNKDHWDHEDLDWWRDPPG
jgi:hypothetical protein